MAYPRPTRETLHRRSLSDLESRLPEAGARIPGHPARIEAQVSADLSHSNHGHSAQSIRQLFPHLCDDRYVDEWARVYKVSDGSGGYGRLRPQKASGTVTLTFTAAGGSPIPSGTLLEIDGRRYSVTTSVTPLAVDLEAEVEVSAVDRGAAGNADAGTTISLVSPLSDVDSDGTVGADGLSGGSDLESAASCRARVLDKIQAANSGGGPGDYKVLARAASSLVTRAWEVPRYYGAGTMVVLIANDNEDPPEADTTLVSTVQDALQKPTPKTGYTQITGSAPMTAVVTVASVDTKALSIVASFELEDGEVWDDGEGGGVLPLVEIEIAAMILLASEVDTGPTITLEEIGYALNNAAGVKSHTLTSPAADVTHTALQIPVAGAHTLTES